MNSKLEKLSMRLLDMKNIEALVSPLIIKRLRKKGGVYINKEIIGELLYFLI